MLMHKLSEVDADTEEDAEDAEAPTSTVVIFSLSAVWVMIQNWMQEPFQLSETLLKL